MNYDDKRDHWIVTGGFEYKIVQVMQKYFNFSIEIHNFNRTWGSRSSKGVWDGLIGGLVDQNIDLAVGGITMNAERFDTVKFLPPHTYSSLSYATPIWKPIQNYHRLASKPFESTIWYLFIASLVICSLFNVIYNKHHRRLNLVWLSVVILFRQHWHKLNSKENNYPSFNLWFMIWNFGAFILTTAYATRLYSLLTIPNHPEIINTASELMDAVVKKNYHVVMIRNSVHTENIKVKKEFSK